MNTTFHCGQIRLEHCGCQIKIQGWVKKIREMGGLCFVDVQDK